jgi:hypothetical protein
MVLAEGTDASEIYIQKNFPPGTYIQKVKQNELVSVVKVFKE